MGKQANAHPALTAALQGAIVLITGGGRGIGCLYAHHLAREGAFVVLFARSAGELRAAAKSIKAEGGRVATFVADVTRPAVVRRVVARIEEKIGPIDVLINNAGVSGPVGNTWDCDGETWWRTLDINLGGAAVVSCAVIPRMAGRKKGRIVNIVSEAGAFRWPTVSAYSVSKAALIKFSENLALECKDFSLRVFAYHPGFLDMGVARQALALEGSSNPLEARVAAWSRAQLDADDAPSPEESAAKLASLLSGAYDVLSGRYITVRDDLDALVRRIEDKNELKDYLMLRVRT